MEYIQCYEIESKQKKILKKSRTLPMVFKILMEKFCLMFVNRKNRSRTLGKPFIGLRKSTVKL